MAHVTAFRIEGLAGRRRLVKLELNPDVNVFWGLNGTGKTSLLKILHSALTNDPSNLVRVPFRSAEVTIAVNDTTVVRRIDKRDAEVVPSEMDEAEYEVASRSIATGEPISQRQFELLQRARTLHWQTEGELPERYPRSFAHRYLPISRVSDVRQRPRGMGRPVAELLDEATFDELFAQQIQDIWRDYNTQALTRIRSVQERGLAQVLSVVLGKSLSDEHEPIQMDSEEAYTLVKQFFAMQRLRPNLPTPTAFAGRYSSEVLVRQIVAEIADVQREVDRAQEPQHRIELLISDLFSGSKKVTFESRAVAVTAGSHDVPIESLSSGEKQMLRILLECIAARTNCIMIDEPELSMHVDWQHRLVDCMRVVNADAQIILATHSPEVMAQLPDHAIFEL